MQVCGVTKSSSGEIVSAALSADDREDSVSDSRTISIIMPTFNVEAFVAEALDSVESQTWPNIELIVIDDGSTDSTPSILSDRATTWDRPGRTLHLVRQANAGAAAARNRGLDLATGAFVAFLDAEDRLYPNCLTRLTTTLDAAPDLDITLPEYSHIDEFGLPAGTETKAHEDRFHLVDLMLMNPIHSATGVLVRREAAMRADRFDPALHVCTDLDFWARIAALRPGNIGGTSEVLAGYRKRREQVSGARSRMRQNWLRVWDKLRAAGLVRSPRGFARAYGRNAPDCSRNAHQAGSFADARRLVAEMWRYNLTFAATNPLAQTRSLSVVSTLSPEQAHKALRLKFNAARTGCRA